MATGMQYNLRFTDTRVSSNNAFSTFNPQLSSGFNFNFTQPLLRGRGMFITRLPISIARSKLKAADFTLRDQVIQLMTVA